jgi:Na+-transporting NADH:ubiquinone oxidoreductase subunit C
VGERESVPKTLAVAAAVALFCSLFVSAAVYSLRPIQLAHRSLDRSRAILVAAGLLGVDEAASERDIVDRYLDLEARIVDLDLGSFTDADRVSAAAYDYRSAGDPGGTAQHADAAEGAAPIRRPRYMPVYLLRRGRAVERIVLPVYGPGMWSTIHGYVSLGSDLTTIAGVRFHEHGETPGIGDRIQNPAWAGQWGGKRMYAEDGGLALRIGSEGGDVDAITGASVTVAAVDGLVRYWFGEDGYGPFLANLRSETH